MSHVTDKTRTYALEAVLGLALVIAPGVAAGAAMDSEHGNIAEWVAAIATTLAFVAAFFAAHYTKNAYEIEQAREDRTLDAIEREQAAKVAAWTAVVPIEHSDGTKRPGQLNFMIRNASDVPVTGVTVRFFLHQWRDGEPETITDLGFERFTLVPPNPEPFKLRMSEAIRAVVNKAWIHDPGTERDIRARLRFVDASGQAWQRLPSGELSKLDLAKMQTEDAGQPVSVEAALND